MFEYFPGNYWWSAMVMNSLGMGGEISEIDRFCKPLKEVAGTRELMGTDDDSKGAAWVSAWRDLSNHLERLAAADAGKGLRAGASRKYLRAANYGFVGEVIAPHDRPEKLEIYTDAQRQFREGMALSGFAHKNPPAQKVCGLHKKSRNVYGQAKGPPHSGPL